MSNKTAKWLLVVACGLWLSPGGAGNVSAGASDQAPQKPEPANAAGAQRIQPPPMPPRAPCGCKNSEPGLKKAVADARKRHGANSRELAAALIALANLHQKLHENAAAEAEFQQALSILTSAKNAPPEQVAQAQAQLGIFYYEQGRPQKGSPLCDSAIKFYENKSGAGDLSDIEALERIGQIHLFRGNVEEGRKCFQKVVNMRSGLLGDKAVPVAESLEQLSLLYRQGDQLAQAEKFLKQAIEIRKNQKQLSGRLVWDLESLAGIYLGQKRYLDAENSLRQASTVGAKITPPVKTTKDTAAHYASMLHALKNDAEAKRFEALAK